MNDRSPRHDRTPARGDAATRRHGPGGSDRPQRERSTSAVAVATGTDTRVTGPSLPAVDVICAGMYRACSTWQYEVVAHLLEHHRNGRRLGYLTAEQYAAMMSPDAAGGGPRHVPSDGWRVFKSHDGDRCFARAIAEGRAAAVYAYRDIRDVVFSLMHKRKLTFEQLLRQGMIHQVLVNDRFWTRRPDVLIQRYDRILADPVTAVVELAHHVGIEPAEGEAEQIAHEYSLASNKARAEALRRRLEASGVDVNVAANAQICDSTTLLHWNHVRDGGSGSWFVESTPRQRVILHRLCGRWLTSRGYPRVPDGAGPAATETRRRSLAERLRVETDILTGWLSCRARAASQRFPGLAAAAKRLLGITDPSHVGATVWSDSNRDAAEEDAKR